MANTTFTWFPDQSWQEATKPSVQPIKFGDGYEARFVSGINTMPDKWSVRFNRSDAEIGAIRDFLRARAALEAFNWTNPLNEVGVYVCRDWSVQRKGMGVLELSCNFERVFEA